MKAILESVVVAAGLLVWFAIQGWLIPPMARGTPKDFVSRHSSFRFSLHTMLITATLVAVMLGLVRYIVW